MRFIKVTALPCNAQGNTGTSQRVEFHLNYDLIGAIRNNGEVLLKGNKILVLSGNNFTNISLAPGFKLTDF